MISKITSAGDYYIGKNLMIVQATGEIIRKENMIIVKVTFYWIEAIKKIH